MNGEVTTELHLQIYGQVQGVFFRTTVQSWAQELGLNGYVSNSPYGPVQVVAQGDSDQLVTLQERCYHGVRAAHVDHVDASWREPRIIFNNFIIR